MKSDLIDHNKWITQQSLATELGVTVQCVHNWMGRKKIEFKKITGSRLILVNKESAPKPRK